MIPGSPVVRRTRLRLLSPLLWAGLLAVFRLGAGVRYQLASGSHLLDQCPPCGRPDIPMAIQGGFELELIDENPLFARHAVRDLDFRGQDLSGAPFRIRGVGELTVGGEVAVTHELRLDVVVEMAGTNLVRSFTNDSPALSWHWPNLGTDLTAMETTFTQVLRLGLRAVPAREVWFQTRHGMTSGNTPPPFERYEGGDVLTREGRRVRRLPELLRRLGVMPPVPPLALDGFGVLPGGELAFSLREPVFSETLGPLGDGDLLGESGRIVARHADLVRAFRPAGEPDGGLDGFQRLADGEMLFSMVRPVPIGGGGVLDPRDILSDRGRVVVRFKEVLAAFAPAEPASIEEVGIDAFHVWPSGEVWFSVDRGFQSGTVMHVGEGDLLSSFGWVVWRNLDLVAPFQPLEDLADFGLAGLFVVTDLDPPAPPAFLMRPRREDGALVLEWSGSGRVSQVESADANHWPLRWTPVSPAVPDLEWRVVPAGSPEARLYRVRSW